MAVPALMYRCDTLVSVDQESRTRRGRMENVRPIARITRIKLMREKASQIGVNDNYDV